jgi:hypothetical protein
MGFCQSGRQYARRRGRPRVHCRNPKIGLQEAAGAEEEKGPIVRVACAREVAVEIERKLTEGDLRAMREAFNTDGVDGKNFDCLCFGLLKFCQLCIDKMLIDKSAMRGR